MKASQYLLMFFILSIVSASILEAMSEDQEDDKTQNEHRLQQRSSRSRSRTPTTTDSTFQTMDEFYRYELLGTPSTPGGNITVGDYSVKMYVTVAPEDPTTHLKAYNQTTNPFNPSFQRRYNPKDSKDSQEVDVFRYQDGTYGSIGYYWQDEVCIYYSSSSLSFCWDQVFQADQFYSENYEPFEGVIGLGIGSPRYGNSFLANLKADSSNAAAMQWSVVSGPYATNQTKVIIGGTSSTYLETGDDTDTSLGVKWNNLTTGDTTWTIPLQSMTFEGEDIYDADETPEAHFNININTIQLPTTIYNKVKTIIQAKEDGHFTCTSSMCSYNGLCSGLSEPLGSLVLNFNGNFSYSLPYTVDVADEMTDWVVTCQVRIVPRTDSLKVVELGLPFFYAFQVTFDTEWSSIGISKTKYSHGTVTDTTPTTTEE